MKVLQIISSTVFILCELQGWGESFLNRSFVPSYVSDNVKYCINLSCSDDNYTSPTSIRHGDFSEDLMSLRILGGP